MFVLFMLFLSFELVENWVLLEMNAILRMIL